MIIAAIIGFNGPTALVARGGFWMSIDAHVHMFRATPDVIIDVNIGMDVE